MNHESDHLLASSVRFIRGGNIFHVILLRNYDILDICWFISWMVKRDKEQGLSIVASTDYVHMWAYSTTCINKISHLVTMSTSLEKVSYMTIRRQQSRM